MSNLENELDHGMDSYCTSYKVFGVLQCDAELQDI